jgi:phosphoesterase RecJ-like protein
MGKRPRSRHSSFPRSDRIGDALRREIAVILLRETSDPRIAMASVTAVEVSPDLKHAKVFVSVLGDEAEQEAAMDGLTAAAGYVRRLLADRISMRQVPEVHFKLDRSLERAARLDSVLKDLARTRECVDLAEAAREVRDCRRALVVSHEHPEGDAIGSTLALALALAETGKEVVAYNVDGVPETFAFLPGADRVVREIESADPFDVVFLVDCGAFDRGGKRITDLLAAHRNVVNIDHHATNERFGRWNVVVSDASSTGEIVHRVLTEAGIEISPDVATNLYTAILTDTGSFQNGATGPAALRACADLIEAGADPAAIADRVYFAFPARRQRLLGAVLSTLRLDAGGRIASMVVTRAMMEELGANPADLEGFVEELRRVRGATVALLIRQDDELVQKASMRSRDGFDVAEIASVLGGGGHKAAAGCTLRGVSIDEARARMIEEIRRRLPA